jgi:hypothetical protein
MNQPRIAMLAVDCESTRILYHALAKTVGVERVILEAPVPRLEFLRRRARRLGWVTVFGQVLFMAGIVPLLRREAATRLAEIKKDHCLCDGPIPDAALLRVPSANAPECQTALCDFAPDAVIVNGTRILSRELLEAIPVPFFNIHAGITPLYRGVHGGYWALVNADRDHCGVTVHRVDTGIDTGPIIGNALIRPTEQDNFVSYPLLQLVSGISLLLDALRGERASSTTLAGRSRLGTHPPAFDYLHGRWLRGVR